MTRIALLAGTYQPNHCGVAHYASRLRQKLSANDIQSVVLTTHDAAKAVDEATVLGVVNDWRWTNLIPLVRGIHAAEADLLHIQHAAGTYSFERAVFLLPLLLRLSGWRSPIVATIHEYGWWEWQPKFLPAAGLEALKQWGQQRGWWDREDGFLLTGSDAIITTNANATEVIQARLPGLKPRLHEIAIGANIDISTIDRAKARAQLQQQYGWSNDCPIIAFFGFLHPVKGLETLLPAFKHVLTQHPHAKLLLIGGVESLALPSAQATQYWNQLQATIAALELESAVRMTGYLDAEIASQFLKSADIGVLPFNHGVTLKSGSLLALMAHSLPIVATRSDPADPTLNENLVRLVTPRQAEQLATELNRLLADSNLRSQLSKAGQAFSQRYNWETIANTHREIYQTVLAQPSPLDPRYAQ